MLWRLARFVSLGGLVGLVACGTLLAISPDDGPAPTADSGPEAAANDGSMTVETGADAATEAAADAGLCDLDGAFGTPSIIVTSAVANASAALSEDERVIYVDTLVGFARQAIFVSKRVSIGDPFPGGSEITGQVAAPNDTYNATLSTDGLSLIFTSNLTSPGQYRL